MVHLSDCTFVTKEFLRYQVDEILHRDGCSLEQYLLSDAGESDNAVDCACKDEMEDSILGRFAGS